MVVIEDVTEEERSAKLYVFVHGGLDHTFLKRRGVIPTKGGPQQHETPEQKHSPTDISKRLRSSENNMDCIYMTPLHCLFALSLF